MGEVFLTHDPTLNREVALKFLSPSMQQDPAAHKRFVREARSAAALDHPYICGIHEGGESEGKKYIVMEYVDGRPPMDKLRRGPLPLDQALQIATGVAEALPAAHCWGIVHRHTPSLHERVVESHRLEFGESYDARAHASWSDRCPG